MPRAFARLPMGRHARRVVLALACLTVFACYAATTAEENLANDVLSSSVASWRIGTTGQPWFDGFPLDEIRRPPGLPLWTAVAENGHTAVIRSPGAIAVGIPAYALAGGGTAAADFSLLPGSLTAAGLAVASLLLLLLALRRTQRDVDAAACVLALGFTTPMWSGQRGQPVDPCRDRRGDRRHGLGGRSRNDGGWSARSGASPSGAGCTWR